MSTNFPASVDTYTNPAPTDTLDSVSVPHAAQHDNLNDAMTAVQTYALANGLLTGSGVPAGGTGVNTNLYLDTASGIIYRKTAGTWAAIYTPSSGGGSTGVWTPADSGFKGWNFDPLQQNLTQNPNSNTLYAFAVDLPAATITKIYLAVTSTSSSTNTFFAMYTGAGALLAQSTNQAAIWGSTGLKTITIAPGATAAGKYYLTFWTDTGAGQVAQYGNPSGGAGFLNGLLTAGSYRTCTANTGLTVTAPATMGTQTALNTLYWMACS